MTLARSLRMATLTAMSGVFALAGMTTADWVVFEDETDTRLVADPEVGVTDAEERDYTWGDLNNNGWIDLVVMRKQPFTTSGARRNVLFMNEDGVLVDRSTEYASMSDVTGDEGFLTPTNDRDCEIIDIDNNGWLDIVTAVTLSDGTPKHISHPRVYKNQGNDNGAWLGFIYEESRIPQLEGTVEDGPHKGFPHAPRFSAVTAGDVTGDGYADLYFGDHNPWTPQTLDFDDRLLINDGNGFFADETWRIPESWITGAHSVHLTSAFIGDLNDSGVNDIVRNNGTGAYDVRVFYNDPADPGHFITNQFVVGGSPYYVSAGDMNNNGRIDLVVARDGFDLVLFNTGTDDTDHVEWVQHDALPNSIGLRSNVILADLNNSGWLDIMIANVHVDLVNFGSHARMYQNHGDGEQPTFTESYGNLSHSDFTNTFDIAAFDITGNGWNDLVVATGCKGCNTHGTTVFINQGSTPCPEDLSGDDIVNVLDILILLEEWGECDNQNDCPADLNGDGEVNVLDLLILLEAWGQCP